MTNTPEGVALDRRDFLKATGATLGFLPVLDSMPERVLEAWSAPQSAGPGPLAFEVGVNDDVILRMQADLRRALDKPVEQRRWVMVIDLRKCVGCHACTISCVAENKLPPGVVYRPVLEQEIGVYPNVSRQFVPRPCMQCDEPPCTPVCPVTATYKNDEGVVIVDYETCIGCRACITACPYGARTSDFGYMYNEDAADAAGLIFGRTNAESYERVANFEYSREWERGDHRASPIGNARKCHFCLHRVHEGQLPACVTTCIGRATLYGDANDPDSVVSKMIALPNVMRLKEELGTEPRVYYIM